MDDASDWAPSRDANGRFLPGNGGRPRGARNWMSRRIVQGVLRHYEEHEAEILERMTRNYTGEFMRLVGRIAAIGPEDVLDLEPLPPEEAASRAELAAALQAEADEAARKEFRAAIRGLRAGDDDAK